jgi:hypothetical protein
MLGIKVFGLENLFDLKIAVVTVFMEVNFFTLGYPPRSTSWPPSCDSGASCPPSSTPSSSPGTVAAV